jgi:hypothetical protein
MFHGEPERVFGRDRSHTVIIHSRSARKPAHLTYKPIREHSRCQEPTYIRYRMNPVKSRYWSQLARRMPTVGVG